MTKYVPPSFNAARVRAGLLKAMGFGEPTRAADKVTFHLVTRPAVEDADGDGVPFDPSVRVTATDTALAVTCALDYLDDNGEVIAGGDLKPARVRVTLLDAEYQQIKSFDYLTAGGDRYARDSIAPPFALGGLDVWTVYATAEDER